MADSKVTKICGYRCPQTDVLGAMWGRVLKLEAKRPQPERSDSPLTPELKEFIARAIVPALVKQYLAEAEALNRLAKPAACVAKSVNNSTAAPPREQ